MDGLLESFGRKGARLGLLGLVALAGAACFPIARYGVYLEGTIHAVDASGRPRSGVEMRLEDPGVPHRWHKPRFQNGLCTTGEDGACTFQVQYNFCRSIYVPGSWFPPSEGRSVLAYVNGREVGRQAFPDAGATDLGQKAVEVSVVVDGFR